MSAGAATQDIARRYATAFFALAKEQGKVDAVEKDMAVLAALAKGDGFDAFAANTTLKRADSVTAVTNIATELKLDTLTQKFVGLLAEKRRLPVLAAVVGAVQSLIATEKGEVTAQVVSAAPMTKEQTDKITLQLGKSLGMKVKIEALVDEAIIGGLIVRVGSKLMDGSVRTKLERLHRALKTSNELTAQKKMKEVA